MQAFFSVVPVVVPVVVAPVVEELLAEAVVDLLQQDFDFLEVQAFFSVVPEVAITAPPVEAVPVEFAAPTAVAVGVTVTAG